MTKTVAVIGGGPAGMEASKELAFNGFQVVLLESGARLGGHMNQWDRLFPNKRPAGEILESLYRNFPGSITVMTETNITSIGRNADRFILRTAGRDVIEADALLVCTGFRVFDAILKEEYGYGIYDNVITSVDLEQWFKEKRPVLTSHGRVPATVGFIHCVGSRDEKSGNLHCSKVCCVTAVKQAVELKEKLPEARIFCFYMDLRMFGLGYEELYKESQEKYRIQFIRGRLSEAFENMDGSLMAKVEDTLTAKPLRINLDLLVLMVGFLPSDGTAAIGSLLGLTFNPNGFLQPRDGHLQPHDTEQQGVFLAGSCKGPKNLEETLADARSAVLRIRQYLTN
ncbi:MAG TPA: FAD-dependent oxidoreductase [Bacteroidales bacterium]|nr:FAD-dependent oxidoreductase [Bacteroidales bacterium]